MDFASITYDKISPYLPTLLSIAFIILLALFANFITNKIYNILKRKYGVTSSLSKVLIKTGIYLFAIILILLSIPGIKREAVQLVGLIFGGIVAFSSSTIIANGMSGILIRLMKQYQINDLIEFEGELGKVTEIGAFHTEIQTEKRKLVTIPNNVMMNNKFSNLSESGVIINANVGIGYDIPRIKVEAVLLQAAKNIGLENPYVSVIELGDYSVKYEINGILRDVGKIIGARSSLKKEVIDECSKAMVEIVSPSFVNVRTPGKKKFIPVYRAEETVKEIAETEGIVEKEMFEKAEKEKKIIQKKEIVESQLDELRKKAENLDSALKKVKNKTLKGRLVERRKVLDERIKQLEELAVKAKQEVIEKRVEQQKRKPIIEKK